MGMGARHEVWGFGIREMGEYARRGRVDVVVSILVAHLLGLVFVLAHVCPEVSRCTVL